MSNFDLKTQMRNDHFIENGSAVLNYPTRKIDFLGVLQKTLVSRYGLDENFILSKIHETLSDGEIKNHLEYSGHWHDSLQILGEPMMNEYYKFVNWLSYNLAFDFVFENNPLVRYHIPSKLDDRYRLSNGELFTYHSDTLLGDYFQQINMWVPFCDVKNTSTLSVCSKNISINTLNEYINTNNYIYDNYKESRVEFFNFVKLRPQLLASLHEDSMSANLRYGQCLMFDPRILHGTAENNEGSTRISMDFRVIPVENYESIMEEINQKGKIPNSYEGNSLIKGEFYNSLTAREIIIH